MEKKRNRILILGNFGYANHDLNGQTIKTRYTLELVKSNYDGEVDYFDTQTFTDKRNIFRMIRKLVSCDKLIYLPAHSNLKYIFPIIYILSRIIGFDIIYSVIGGWLVPYLKNKPLHRFLLKRIFVILAETVRMREDLENTYDFKNVSVLYNFRIIDFVPAVKEHDGLRLLFMARIDKLKGLDTIFSFCEMIKSLENPSAISLDFYGPFSPNVVPEEFLSEVAKYSFVKYNGTLEPEAIVRTISEYDLLLLPTHYYTEGLPGTIIESYLAGVPVVVSDWMHAREFVEDGVCGFIVPFENHQKEFDDIIMRLNNDRELLCRIKEGAINQADKFKEKAAWKVLSQYVE